MIGALFLLTTGVASPPPAVYVLKGKSAGHTYEVTFKEGPFQAHGRKLVWYMYPDPEHPKDRKRATYEPGYMTKAGQQRFWGSDSVGYDQSAANDIKKEMIGRFQEIASMTVKVDGKVWPVKRSLYDDLLNPYLSDKGGNAQISDGGKTLVVTLYGSDGAGSYSGMWTFRRNGKHTRSVGSAG